MVRTYHNNPKPRFLALVLHLYHPNPPNPHSSSTTASSHSWPSLEMAVDMTRPVEEGTSNGILQMFDNFMAVCLIGIANLMRGSVFRNLAIVLGAASVGVTISLQAIRMELFPQCAESIIEYAFKEFLGRFAVCSQQIARSLFGNPSCTRVHAP